VFSLPLYQGNLSLLSTVSPSPREVLTTGRRCLHSNSGLLRQGNISKHDFSGLIPIRRSANNRSVEMELKTIEKRM
jgi:hypothetical protein